MTRYGEWVEYECDLGCRGADCPRHKIRIVSHITSGTYSFEIETLGEAVQHEYIDGAKLKAMLQTYESISKKQ